MARGSRIVAISSGSENADAENVQTVAEAESPLTLEDTYAEDRRAPEALGEDGARAVSLADRIAPIIACSALIGWTVFFVWANRGDILFRATALQWSGWIAAWSAPSLLIGVLWLLAMRNSRREAARFGDTARLLHDEAVRLESRLTVINGELSLAREFIAAQARDLEALGRVASDRLSQNAEKLAGLIHTNGMQVTSIGDVSEAALENMERLRGQLPVIAASAKDVTSNIGNAGRAAQAQLQEMLTGFLKLNEFGSASERQVEQLRAKVEEAIVTLTRQAAQMDDIANARFTALADRNTAFQIELESNEAETQAAIRSRAALLSKELEQTRRLLDSHEAESLISLRARLSALRDEGGTISRTLRDGETGALAAWRVNLAVLDADIRKTIDKLDTLNKDAMVSSRERLNDLLEEAARFDQGVAEHNRYFAEEMDNRRVDAEIREEQAIARLREQLTALDADIARRQTEQQEQAQVLISHTDTISEQLERFARQMADIVAQGGNAETAVASSLQVLADKLVASRDALNGTDQIIATLTDSSVRLLELIQAGAHHSREDLTQGISVGEERLEALVARAASLRDVVESACAQGEALSGHAETTREALAELDRLHGEIDDKVGNHATAIAAMHRSLLAVHEDSNVLSDKAQNDLRSAIELLITTAREAVVNLEEDSAIAITALANRLAEESGHAIDKAMQEKIAQAAGQLEQAAVNASGISREAAMQLREQLGMVNELAGNLERRVEQARERAEEQVDNDFARRAALITESLNSNAIDIAKALDTDISDTAWAGYLRGDRGIFTRRAMRLLSAADAKSIVQVYENDRDFRDHVSHYIHDFEAMLRQLLSTRDGHALSVTLLSSDMGKLYVAMAQAIERLRN